MRRIAEAHKRAAAERANRTRITAAEFVTLDGVVEDPNEWVANDDQLQAAIGAQMTTTDAILLGRVTYEGFASHWPAQKGAIADYMNNTPKYVVSTTLDSVEWQNSTLIKENIAEEIRALKQGPAKRISVTGSASLAVSLLQEGLLDELELFVHPLIRARGRRLFDAADAAAQLELVESAQFSTGVVALKYRPGNHSSG
jgi:dihydrofolate reductase